MHWGGLDGIHPVGVLGACIALAVSPPLGALAAFALVRAVRRGARRASRRWHDLAQAAQWATSATLAFSHGANDAQKSAGVIAAVLLADGRIDALAAPLWATIGCAAALTLGTAAGGWSIMRTVGRRIYHLHPVDGLCSQGASAAVILGASLVGAPTSTTQVVASSIVGVGGGRRRWHHVRWSVVRQMGLAWVVTMPASAAIAAVALLALAGGDVSRHHWFLPDMPDILGLLRRQVDAHRAGRWTRSRPGPPPAATRRPPPPSARSSTRPTRPSTSFASALRSAFVTPLDPEDLFALSRGIDWILNHAEGCDRRVGGDELPAGRARPPRWPRCWPSAVHHIDEGVAQLAGRSGDADEARRRRGQGPAPAREGLPRRDGRARGARRRAHHAGPPGALPPLRADGRDSVVDVAERLIYAVLKES